MEIVATQKFVRMSPQKLRLVVRAVKEIKDPDKLLAYLVLIKKRAALPILKTIKQALGNAKNNLGVTDRLKVKEIQIGEGPRLKRFRAGSRGIARPILKRTSHVRIVLETEKQDQSDLKSNIKDKEAEGESYGAKG